jgi:hypothetical protein
MTLEDIHQEKAKQLRAKTRREVLMLPILLIVVFVFMATIAHGLIPRIGLAVSVLWTLVVQLPAIRRAWSRTPAGEAALLSGLEFYRRELEFRLTRLRRPWRTMVAPALVMAASLVAPAIVAVIQKPALAVNMAPFLIMMAAWVVAVLWLIRQQAREIKLEIAELDALDRWRQSGS